MTRAGDAIMGFPSPKGTLMFHHIVLLRFLPESTPEQHRAVVDGLRALPPLIGEIRSYDVQLDAGLAPDNAHVSVHATFGDESAWRTYSIHPDHLKVIEERIIPILDTATRTQYRD